MTNVPISQALTSPMLASPPAWIRRHAGWLGLLSVAALAIAAYLTVVPDGLDAYWYMSFSLIAGVTVLFSQLRYRLQPRLAFLALAAGLLLTGAGDFTWTSMANAGLEPFPSVADALYISGSLLMVLGVWLRFARQLGGFPTLIEALIPTTAGTVLLWEFLIEPLVEGGGGDLVYTATAVAYPAIDILLLGLIARLLLSPARRSPAFWLTVVAYVGFMASDIGYAMQLFDAGYIGGLIDTGWLAGYIMLGASALHPVAREAERPARADASSSRPRLLILGSVTLIAPLLIVLEDARGDSGVPLLAGTAALLSILVFVRLSLAVRALHTTLAQRDELHGELAHSASHDSLTGLANRAAFANRLEREVATGGQIGVLFIDVDDFKSINDSFGHQEGDHVLIEIGKRIQSRLRPADLVARFGGDEFAILLGAPISIQAAEMVGDRIFDAIREPIELGEYIVLPRVSMGIAVSEGLDSELAMRHADVAMYLAKSQGKDRRQTFDDLIHGDLVARLNIRLELEQAIKHKQFVLQYQPITDVRTMRVVGTEALVRWDHPERGMLVPDEFIEVAESTGLIVPLGAWVLATAIATTRRWQRELDRPDLSIAVNVSARQFADPSFAGQVSTALRWSGFAADRLTLEITESALLDTAATAVMLHELKELGVRISVDDFGTGYSSLSYVGRLPVDEVKIDRSFVAGLGSDDKEGALAASVIRLGKTLDLKTVAEGVEDQRQLDILQSLGCDYAQGFFLARPMGEAAAGEAILQDGLNVPVPAAAA